MAYKKTKGLLQQGRPQYRTRLRNKLRSAFSSILRANAPNLPDQNQPVRQNQPVDALPHESGSVPTPESGKPAANVPAVRYPTAAMFHRPAAELRACSHGPSIASAAAAIKIGIPIFMISWSVMPTLRKKKDILSYQSKPAICQDQTLWQFSGVSALGAGGRRPKAGNRHRAIRYKALTAPRPAGTKPFTCGGCLSAKHSQKTGP